MRRWKVRISNIRVKNLSTKTLNIFLQFNVGGNYLPYEQETKKKKKIIDQEVVMGPNLKTEFIEDLG